MMNKEKRNMRFICTNSKDVRDKLVSYGFTEITETNSPTFCFINNGKMTFDINPKDIVYTNIMCL